MSVQMATDSKEIELKLALPGSDPSTLARRLARIPLLARRQSTKQLLHNIYYDTPEQILRQRGVALRLRRVGDAAKRQWLQTLKTGGRNDSALSQRGEWEVPVRSARLSLRALQDTPWAAIDPEGTVFPALTPAFEITFERTLWLLRRRDGSRLELALDIGQIAAGDRTTPVCEMELELKAGRPAALFEVARQIAQSIFLLPASSSKAERGYALAQNSINAALRAQSRLLPSRLTLSEVAQSVLREMFSQFTTNLNALLVSDDPEVVHQARVGWRRFKSAWRFFRPVLAIEAIPSWQPLQALLTALGKSRDLDVARLDILPPIATAYVADDPRRAEVWQRLMLALDQSVSLQRKAVYQALQEPAVGACLLATTQWLESLTDPPAPDHAGVESDTSPRRWTQARIKRLHKKLQVARKDVDQPDQEHRVRILAKRMRYNVEAVQSLLPSKLAIRWQQQASSLQTSLGALRDARQTAVLAAELEVDRGLAEFLRGFAAEQHALSMAQPAPIQNSRRQ